jgi:hypothetical protein
VFAWFYFGFELIALSLLAEQNAPFLDEARGLTHVLPPKPSGVLTVLDVLSNVDYVFFAHAGLKAFAEIKDLSSGEVVGSTVRIRCWRVAAQDIPQTVDERLRWLFAQWGKMNAFVRNARETK